MGESYPFVIALIAVAFATVWLTLYTIGLYRVGVWLAHRFRIRRRHGQIYFLIGFWSGVPASLCLLLPYDLFVRGMLVVGVWILHSHPIGAGYWAGNELASREDHKAFRERTDEWLRQWEAPPSWMPDDSEN